MSNRRQVALMLDEQEILDVFNGVTMAECEVFPPDTKVVGVYHDWYRKAFALCLESSYFKEVLPNCELIKIGLTSITTSRDLYFERVW